MGRGIWVVQTGPSLERTPGDPMRAAMLALAAGLLLLRFLPQLPPVSVLPFVLAAGLALLPFRWRAVGCFLCGFARACHREGLTMDAR